jgi:hypothetical protein
VDDRRLLVGTDACVLIEGIHLRGRLPANQPKRPRTPLIYPSVRILRAAELRWFRLCLSERALEEAARALRSYSKEDELTQFLEQLDDICYCTKKTADLLGMTAAEYAAELSLMTASLKHENDAPIAVDMKYSGERPHVFVSSNHTHWKQAVGDAIGGVRVVRSTEFAARLTPQAAPGFGFGHLI